MCNCDLAGRPIGTIGILSFAALLDSLERNWDVTYKKQYESLRSQAAIPDSRQALYDSLIDYHQM